MSAESEVVATADMTALGAATDSADETANRTPTVVIEPVKGLVALDLPVLWEYRDLLYFLVWRDVKVRYKQTAIGIAWVVLQPLLTMVVFSLIFGRFAKIPSEGLPYPVFIYAGLLPWNLFASALSRGGESVVQNSTLISKIYFPRLILPIAGIISPLIDFAVAFIVLIVMMIWFGIAPSWVLVTLPLFVLLAVLTALAVSLCLSALNVRYRDVGYAIPFLIQLWMFASPVAYPASLIPERWRVIYGLNPMCGVIEGFRWGLLGKTAPDFRLIAVSASVVAVLMFASIVFFRKTERTFADII
jgi:homopolymeric O-antigen transport system permease protein